MIEITLRLTDEQAEALRLAVTNFDSNLLASLTARKMLEAKVLVALEAARKKMEDSDQYHCDSCDEGVTWPAESLRYRAGRSWCRTCWDDYRPKGAPTWDALPNILI